ncbi:hypothetical protein [Nostoc sp.]|uniref:hypothetical protein n=1 Tax=Nostoc sp. TaxID=1180 RepID=UPI002FF4B873
MPLNFTFALSQQQTFELRCDYGSRRLDTTELAALIDYMWLNNPEYFLPRLNQRLEEIVGDGWLFDCSQFEVEE